MSHRDFNDFDFVVWTFVSIYINLEGANLNCPLQWNNNCFVCNSSSEFWTGRRLRDQTRSLRLEWVVTTPKIIETHQKFGKIFSSKRTLNFLCSFRLDFALYKIYYWWCSATFVNRKTPSILSCFVDAFTKPSLKPEIILLTGYFPVIWPRIVALVVLWSWQTSKTLEKNSLFTRIAYFNKSRLPINVKIMLLMGEQIGYLSVFILYALFLNYAKNCLWWIFNVDNNEFVLLVICRGRAFHLWSENNLNTFMAIIALLP